MSHPSTLRPRSGRRSRLRDDDGSVMILAAGAMAVILAATAMAVDVGRLSFASRELQSTADVAALDAVRALGDREDPSRTPEEHATALAHDALARNAGFVENAAGTPGLVVALGRFDTDAWAFRAGVTPYNAVRVQAGADVPYVVLPGSRDVAQDAVVAVADGPGCPGGCTPPSTCPTTPCTPPSVVLAAEATIGIGSIVASAEIDSTLAGFLNRLLGALGAGPVSLDVVGYRGLADADVTIADLTAQLGLGTPDEAADANVTYADLLRAAATVLQNSGTAVDAAAVTPLLSLANSVRTDISLRFGDLFSAGTGRGSALDATADVLALVVAAAQVANAAHAVTAELPVTIPGVATATAVVWLVETPQFATGPVWLQPDGVWATTARTAQGRAQLTLVLPDAISIPTLTGTVLADLNVPVLLELGRGTASLTGTSCGADQVQVHATTEAVSAGLGTGDPTTGGTVSPATVVDVAGVVRVTAVGSSPSPDVRLAAAVSTPGGVADLTFGPPVTGSDPQRVRGGSPDLGTRLADAFTLEVDALVVGVSEDAVRQAVAPELTRVLDALDSEVLEPLAESMGWSLADADVWATALDCDRIVTVG
ncbi:MAG TPA: pilus assembly protein TadG-related protein [Nitriliruptorales bacterium]